MFFHFFYALKNTCLWVKGKHSDFFKKNYIFFNEKNTFRQEEKYFLLKKNYFF